MTLRRLGKGNIRLAWNDATGQYHFTDQAEADLGAIRQPADPAKHAAAVTPADDADLADAATALLVGTAGALKVTTTGGETVTFGNVPAGILPVGVVRVFATGTTASNLVALW